jgi:hypothetical protein
MDVDFDQRKYWNSLEIPEEEQEIIYQILTETVNKTFNRVSDEELIESICFLDSLEAKYIDPVMGNAQRKNLVEGKKYIETLFYQQPCIIGISGEPGTGKSTLLKEFTEKGLFCVDEYWNQGQDHKLLQKNNYPREYEKVNRRLERGESSIFAAAFIETSDISHKVVLESSSETRFYNISQRMKEKNSSDSIRLQYQEFYKKHDLLMYGIQKTTADTIINTSQLIY